MNLVKKLVKKMMRIIKNNSYLKILQKQPCQKRQGCFILK